MNNSIIEDITFLENISKSILEEYDKLYDIELGKIDEEYNKVIENIKRLIVFEDGIIDRITHHGDVLKIIEYIAHKYNKSSSVSIGICLNKQDLMEKRIINSLINKVFDNDKSNLESELEPRFYIDLLRLALSIYEKKSSLFKDNNYSKRIKYNVAYLFKGIEDELINDKFLVPEHPFLTYKLLGKDSVSCENINAVVDHECLKLISMFVEVLVKTDLNDRYNEVLICDKEFLSCLLRGCFVLMNEEYQKKVKAASYSLLDSLKMDPSMNTSYILLNNAINNVEIDREIPQMVSFFR